MEDCSLYAFGKVFKVTGKFRDGIIIPNKFYHDFLAMLNTFLCLEANRLQNGLCFATAWPAHRNFSTHFCFYLTFASEDYKIPDSECGILVQNLARRMTEWLERELLTCYPDVVGLGVIPLFNILDTSCCCD